MSTNFWSEVDVIIVNYGNEFCTHIFSRSQCQTVSSYPVLVICARFSYYTVLVLRFIVIDWTGNFTCLS